MFTLSSLLSLALLLATSTLTALAAAFQKLGRLQSEEEIKKERSPFFFRHFLKLFYGKLQWDGLLFSLSFTKCLLQVGFVLSAFSFFIERALFKEMSSTLPWHMLLLIALCIAALSLLFDFLFNLYGRLQPKSALRYLSALGSLLLLFCTPLTALFFRLMRSCLAYGEKQKKLPVNFRIRDKVYEMLRETELDAYLDSNEKKLILSVVSFKERIAREVMVPRINVFSLSMQTRISEAAESFLKEGYSRIPIYKESVDNIVGVLLYKDILNLCIDPKTMPEKLNQPIEKLLKPVLYTPETKKISQLLQEFRHKQIHLAIVVDEYGGTEGIVTFEDILEELVGEIADEYDVGQQALFTSIPGGWLVDAKMAIIDMQEELGIQIPVSAEYDTIGGYVFHRAGTIPGKGWRIHHDAFDLEVISSSERAINKIKIIPHAETEE